MNLTLGSGAALKLSECSWDFKGKHQTAFPPPLTGIEEYKGVIPDELQKSQHLDKLSG
jgi:hypothetical protein